MKTFLSFLLSLTFTLNVAYAGVLGVCDAVDHFPLGDAEQHLHITHHSHNASGDTPESSDHGDGGPLKVSKIVSDHCHAHGTSFSMAAWTNMVFPSFIGQHILVALPASALASTPPDRLERPPRAPLA